MDTNVKLAESAAVEVLDYWEMIPLEDIGPLKLNQKCEQSINALIEELKTIEASENNPSIQVLSFDWSIYVRDFVILLRDTLLATVKDEQLKKDEILFDPTYRNELQKVLRSAAQQVKNQYHKSKETNLSVNEWRHQESPINEVITQLNEVLKQIKKIFRSVTKVDDIRMNIGDYIKDFHIQYSKQSNAVKQLFSIIENVKSSIKDITTESSETITNSVADLIGEYSQKMEMLQGTESIDILPYANRETLSLPVSTDEGHLKFKTINIKSELARWFSSFIYPKTVELERRRDHAVEKCLLVFSQIRTKIAAISLSDIDESIDVQKDFDLSFSQLDKEVLNALKQEADDMNALVSSHLDKYLLASNVYSSEMFFLPENRSSQISNISKDAQKRIVNIFNSYQKGIKNYFSKFLSRYFEVSKTPYSQYIKNQMTIYDEDDSYALFLKNGYLGKSFTVPRPEVINPIVEDYNLWLDGFAGAILLTGLSGSGKSTILGMINHLGLSREIIQLNTGESYFIKHKSYEPECDLKVLIEKVVRQTRGRQVVVCIDNLELWHNDEIGLFENIVNLFEAIIKYRKKVFFIVACSPFLKQRLNLFKDLNTIFSRQAELKKMYSNQIRNALNLRARVNDLNITSKQDLDSKIGNIIRESKGNIGWAMIEYCRYLHKDYKPNVKSQEFNKLIDTYHTLLTFISTYQFCSLNVLEESLSKLDYEQTIESINHLVGQKIVIRPKKDHIAINPSLVHNIEHLLSKYI